MRIDAHQHYWRIGQAGHVWPTPDLPRIHRDFLPADLANARRACDVEQTIAVQSQPADADTDWLLALAADEPSIGGVVGWVDILSPDAVERIHLMNAHPKLCGLRPMLQDLPPAWILQPAAMPAIAAMEALGLCFDALIRPQHLPSIAILAKRHPALRIVVDHGAKPDIRGGVREPWADDLAELASLPNVSCKLSGLLTEAAPRADCDVLRFYVDHIVDTFGPQRVMWGSDWPVLLLAGYYAGWSGLCRDLLATLSPDDRSAIFGGNACRIYGIAERKKSG